MKCYILATTPKGAMCYDDIVIVAAFKNKKDALAFHIVPGKEKHIFERQIYT